MEVDRATCGESTPWTFCSTECCDSMSADSMLEKSFSSLGIRRLPLGDAWTAQARRARALQYTDGSVTGPLHQTPLPAAWCWSLARALALGTCTGCAECDVLLLRCRQWQAEASLSGTQLIRTVERQELPSVQLKR